MWLYLWLSNILVASVYVSFKSGSVQKTKTKTRNLLSTLYGILKCTGKRHTGYRAIVV